MHIVSSSYKEGPMGPEGRLFASRIDVAAVAQSGIRWDATPAMLTNSFSSHSETVHFPLMSNITWQEIKKSIAY